MADKTEFDSRPSQISKDVQASENPIPLSPQWLQAKTGDSKSGITGENHFGPRPGYSSRPDFMKSPGIGEDSHDNNKKKDIFRPSVLDMESGRRDRWRDEERDTNSAVRKDRWREGDKEHGDIRKTERWTDLSGRHYGEARRGPTERWTDSGNRESNHDQRRESKWNTRWGPDDKEADSSREKWAESGKDADLLLDKGSSHLSYHGKDEKEGDHYRPWRMNSSQSRGRAEPPHHQALTPNKQVPVFAHGRGRGESTGPTFSLGRGRISSVSNASPQLQSVGSFSEKGESAHDEALPLRYGRTKLLDLYRTTDTRSSGKFFNGVLQVPSLTQEEPVEPLAFCAPTAEELVILKGIDKGDILSSGAPQITKEGSIGRNSTDFLQSRRSKIGSREDLLNESKDEGLENPKVGGLNYAEGTSQEKLSCQKLSDFKLNAEVSREDNASYRKIDDVPASRETGMHGPSPILHGGSWRSSSFGEHSNSISHDWRGISADASSKVTDMGWSEPQRNLNTEWEKNLVGQSYTSLEGSKWQIGDDPIMKNHNEQEILKVTQSSPEDLVLYYKDPQGEIQGPFTGSDIIGWFEAAYFGIDLQVRVAGAPPDTPFRSLGDVMPHLRAKARPPPGFGVTKPSQIPDASNRLNFNNFGKLHAADVDLIPNEPRYKHNSTEAENRFLESLMSGNMSGAPLQKSALSEGMRGYFGNNAVTGPSLGAESADNLYLLAKKVSLERQRSMPSPYTLWAGRDAASSIPKSDIIQDSPLPHSRLLSSITDNAHLQQPSQNMDLMSILQGLPEQPTTGVNNGVGGWSNFPVQGGLDPLQDKLDVHHGQNYASQAAFGIQQQRLQPQISSPLPNLLGQVIDNPSSIFSPEKLLSSGLSQDPQLLSLLQQQYLLQLQSQAPTSSQQRLLLEKLLLLKQQQKQEEQQQLLRQQQLLSQALSEHNPHQRFGESSYGELLTAGLSTGNAPVDHSLFQPSNNMFPIGSQMQVTNLQDERVSNFIVPPSVSQDVTQNIGAEASSLNLPHQMFSSAVNQRSWDHTLPEKIDAVEQKSSMMATPTMDSFQRLDIANRHQLERLLQSNESISVTASEVAPSCPPGEHLVKSVAHVPTTTGANDNELLTPEQVQKFALPPAGVLTEAQGEGEQYNDESSMMKEVKNVELREVKKSADKKSKKQKSSKAQSSDPAKAVSKTHESRLSEVEGVNIAAGKSNLQSPLEDLHVASAPEQREFRTEKMIADVEDAQQGQKSLVPSSINDSETLDAKGGSGQVGSISQLNSTQIPAGNRAWKPAPGFKPKSLLEIQQEEQRRAQAETAVPDLATSFKSLSVSAPWAGVVANSDTKSSREIKQDSSSSDLNSGKSESSVSQKNKSQLHDLLEDNSMAKTSEREMEIPDSMSSLDPGSQMGSHTESVDDNNFIEAKDSKKGRKKSAKAKGSGTKGSMPITTMSDVSVGLSSIEKGKSSRLVQQEKEALPSIPSGPSLGDFVVWKGESTNSSPAPAWSSDSGKLAKPSSLRDILKEQGKKGSSAQIPVPTPQKPVPSQPPRGGGSSWSISGSSPAKTASPIHSNSQVSLSKHKVEDDLFWGHLPDQPKQEAKLLDFPQLGSQSSSGSKSTLVKSTPGVSSVSRQKSTGGKPAENPLSVSVASIQPSLRAKKDSSTKYSEAMDFREWCENECVRLIGTKDTSFLEFCLKQPRSEAEILLSQNLASFDPDHKFIDKFLSYKDLLPGDVIDMAFQSRNDRRVVDSVAGDVTSDDVGLGRSDQSSAANGATKGGGKKKAKKGKKVSPSVLGFNVVSNRIMMGEIESLED